MIGVIAKDRETRAVREFFELFKTPWEFYLPEHCYDVVIVTSEEVPTNLNTSVLLIYNSRSTNLDDEIAITIRSVQQSDWLEWDVSAFPIYRNAAVFQGPGQPFLWRRGEGGSVGLELSGPAPQTIRLGYDLFEEVAFLLSQGQPSGNAHVPTLDIHISLLRSIMVGSGNPFIEIPPVPAGYDFMACLSHDVDFTGIREHKLDMTTWGFLYRAILVPALAQLEGGLFRPAGLSRMVRRFLARVRSIFGNRKGAQRHVFLHSFQESSRRPSDGPGAATSSCEV